MYEKKDIHGNLSGRINYTVWSDIYACPECSSEIVFFEVALDKASNKVQDSFSCPSCQALLNKKKLDRLYETYFDAATNQTLKRIRRKPVLINYTAGKAKKQEAPNIHDLEIIEKISRLPMPMSVPVKEIPFMHMTHQRARMESFGVTYVHHYFLDRPIQALGYLWDKISKVTDSRMRNMLFFAVEQAIWTMSVLNRYRPTGYSQVNQYMTGVYYIPSQHAECSPWYILEGKLSRLLRAFSDFSSARKSVYNATVTTSRIEIPDNSVDHIFTDPPFGENIYYADLNFLVESWHRVRTNSASEAIIDKAKKKVLLEYQTLMESCFKEYYRVLKPGRWMTMVFHNSKNAVWNAIQEAMLSAGFVISTVRILNKKQGSYRQVTSSAPKEDLIVSAYKPNGGLEKRFKLEAGTEEGVWDFIRTHLQQLPIIPIKDGCAEPVSERVDKMLYDQMVAFHVQRGVTVPLSAAEFYLGLSQRFESRDNMYFLPEQAIE